MINSIAFPKIFNSNSTNIITELNATKQNTKLLLLSEAGDLKLDPYFGVHLKKYLFEQNNVILKDILIDEIYTKLAVFMPQLRFKRSDIELFFDRGKIYGKIVARNVTSFELNSFELQLYEDE